MVLFVLPESRTLLFCLAVFMFLFVGCSLGSDELQSVPVLSVVSNSSVSASLTTESVANVSPGSVDACSNVRCPQGFVCDNGACGCVSGTKLCGPACISSSSCCLDTDCGADQLCESGSCSVKLCDFNQFLNKSSRSCSCVASTSFCSLQNKCVPSTLCCSSTECPRDQNCGKYLLQSYVCLNNSRGSQCKRVLEGQQESFDAGYAVLLVDVQQEGLMNLLVNPGALKFTSKTNASFELPNATLRVQPANVTGGKCRITSTD